MAIQTGFYGGDLPNTIGSWEVIRQLGEGGQSEVFLGRNPKRAKEKQDAVSTMLSALSPKGTPNTMLLPPTSETIQQFAKAAAEFTREDTFSELGALKRFKLRGEEGHAVKRFLNEISILRQNRPGLLKLLDASEREQWIATEYCPNGTIEKSPRTYKENVSRALRAFRSLVTTVASLHADKIVHRDIKPANVFFGNNDTLLLGDFGIVFLPDLAERLTVTEERVGPRDYMPQWGDLGGRLDEVHANFDVYMLGKLLWCMVAGKLKLPREYFRRQNFDLTQMFNDPHMKTINGILDKCVVEDPADCLPSANELLPLVDEALASMEKPVAMLDRRAQFQFPCRMCGLGHYKPGAVFNWPVFGTQGSTWAVQSYSCDFCAHIEFFANGFPADMVKRTPPTK